MKISIITVVYNNVSNIENCIKSVISQDYLDIEYIVIDGGSKDGTIEIIEKYQNQVQTFISESDDGIYDALNKGINHSNGEFIAILHSDDVFYSEHVVSDMVIQITKTRAEFCFSNMIIINSSSHKVSRYYKANFFKKWMFRIGWMPPHPTCFIKKELFNEFGLYSTQYKIAGDFELLVRFFYGRKIKWSYLDCITVKMLSGGVSNSGWRSKVLIHKEISKSLKSNDVWSLSIFQLIRYPIRLMEVLIRPINIKRGCD